MLPWIKAALSDEQLVSLSHDDHHACILASAGSGKTRTLVFSVLRDLAAGIPPSGIVAFTFTEKAADELLTRIHALAREHLPAIDLSGMFIGTIHSWSFNYLVTQPSYLGLTALDDLQVFALVSRLNDYLNLSQVYGCSYPKGIERFISDIEVFYNERLSPDQVPERIRPSIVSFLRLLQENKLITFGGMITAATDHLEIHGPVESLMAVYVDEYQDVNPAQVALIKAMVPSHGRVIAVGDDLQSIYNWRGGNVRSILDFSIEFPEAKVFRLADNYRSRPGIVEAANKVADSIGVKDPGKVMIACRPPLRHREVLWIRAASEQEEVRAVADVIMRFISNGVPPDRIAVLLRSVVGWGRPFIDELTSRGIPVECPMLGKGGGFIEDFVIPVVGWLRDDHSEPKTAEEEAEMAQRTEALWQKVQNWIRSSEPEDDFWDCMWAVYEAIETQSDEARNARSILYDLMQQWRVRVKPDDAGLIVGIAIASQIIRSVEEIHRRKIDGIDKRTPRKLWSEVFYALLQFKDKFGESLPLSPMREGVVVTTVHGAKGLQWPVVIIPRLERGLFPVRGRNHGTTYPDSIAGRYGTTVDDERRLFYVAVTRAQERLILTDSCITNASRTSTFLNELSQRGLTKFPASGDMEPATWEISDRDLCEKDTSPIRIGITDLLLYLECPFQFGLRRLAGVQPSIGDELGFGKGLHNVVKSRFEEGRAWTASELQAQVDEHVTLPYASDLREQQARTTAFRQVNHLESLGAFDGVTESELPVEVAFDAGLVYGIIDLARINDDGSVSLIDWKSRASKSLMLRYRRQLQFYAYALTKSGRQVRGARIIDVGRSDDSGSLVCWDVDVNDDALLALSDSIDLSLGSISDGKFVPTPSRGSCECCDVSKLCDLEWNK